MPAPPRPIDRLLVQTVRSDASMPSPQAEDQQRRKRQKAGETEPALCPVHIDHDGFDLNREDAVATGAFVSGTREMFSQNWEHVESNIP